MPQLTIQEAFNMALQHQQAGRLREAEEIYRRILAEQPNHAPATHYLGVIALQMGRADQGEDLIRRSITLDSNHPDACNNLGIALQTQGKLDEAIAAYRRAIALKPNYPEALLNLGIVRSAKGDIDEAIEAYKRAIFLKPGLAETHFQLGNALLAKQNVAEAIAAFRQAIALNPRFAHAHNNLGTALQTQGAFNEAIEAHQTAVALKPDYPEAHYWLGVALKASGWLDETVAAYRRAISLNPRYAQAYCNLGNVLKDKGQSNEAIAAFRHAIALRPEYADAHNSLIYALYSHPAADARTIALEQRDENRRLAGLLTPRVKTHCNDRDPNRRLRIGYVSPDFRMHPVGRFLLPILENHDHKNFEIYAYSDVPEPFSDEMTQRLRGHTDAWRSIVSLSDDQGADLIRQDRIDILVDLALHTANNRLPIFARKPAPVQVTYLAYAGSSGLSAMDYRLSDPYLDPPGADASIYSEQTVRLPDAYWCYKPMVELPPLPPPAVNNGFVTFGCLNNFCKVNEPLLSLWARILTAVPQAKLILYAPEGDHRHRTLTFLQEHSVQPHRVTFGGKLPTLDYFNLYQSIDIALDTFPYGGGTTSCDALWMGVPLVSLAGKTAVGRGGLSILSNTGLPELVGNTAEDYVQIALALANDPPRLGELRSTLRRRMEASPLMNAPKFVRSMEAAYRHMWRTWCETGE